MCRDCENRTDTLNAVFKARKFIMVKDPTAFKPKVTHSRHRVLHSVLNSQCSITGKPVLETAPDRIAMLVPEMLVLMGHVLH